jgi:alpha,alpha-trehalase
MPSAATAGRRGRQAALLLIALFQTAVAPSKAPAYPDPPQTLFQDLFTAVQTAPLFADGKTFADAVPSAAPQDILAQYRAARPDSPQALKRFVEAHFVLPREPAAGPSPASQECIVAHIDGLWDQLTRSTPSAPPFASLLPLPHPYAVPGGRFREIYYWDSYFTMLGLEESGRQDLAADMVRDFAYLIDTYGHIPNGARTYYLSRSQPPFFFKMVELTSPRDPAGAFARYLQELKREYAFWMDGSRGLGRGSASRRVVALPDGSILNRYWDDRDTPRDESYREDSKLAISSGRDPPQLYRDIRAAAESGWDFSSRWFADSRSRAEIDTTEILPIDLNSLLFGLENAIRAGCQRRADAACVREFSAHAAARRAAIDQYLWDASSGAYFDYRFTHRARGTKLSAAVLYPLFVGLASQAQAASVARIAARDLLKPGGIVTTLLETGQQWDAPNGWAPLQWIAVAGLRGYGDAGLAAAISCRWMVNVDEVYRRSGKLVEKYDVMNTGLGGRGGEYPTQDGFGWTNGVMRKLIALYPAYTAFADAAQCPET